MNLAIALAVFPVIFVGELPDKTMFASLVLASRGHPASVWVGAAGAFMVHVVIATTIGATEPLPSPGLSESLWRRRGVASEPECA